MTQHIVKGVEIFATGIWNGRPIKQNDIVQMARNQQTLGTKIRVPLKFGHNDEQKITDGQPALGWVTRLRIIGSKLVADFEQVPDIVHAAIKAGRYDRVSSEVLFGVKLGEEEIGTVLVGVALLGADLPAVTDLIGLGALVASASLFQGDMQTISFSAGNELAHLELEEQEGAKPNDKEQDMEDLKKLQGEMATLQASMQTLQDNLASEKTRADTATGDLEKFQKLEQEREDTAIAELFTASRRNIVDQCESLVKEGKLTPALRDKVVTAVDAGQSKFSKNGKTIMFSSELVMELVKSFSGELPQGESGTGAGQEQGKGEKPDETPDITLDRLIRKYMAEHKFDPKDQAQLQEAHIAVLSDESNRELADEYEQFISIATAN